MKKLSYFLFVFAVFGLLLTGCSDDSGTKVPPTFTASGSGSGSSGSGSTGGGTTPSGPTISDASYDDSNQSGTVDSGDTLILTFSEDVVLGQSVTPDENDFQLPVSGDSLGSGVTVQTTPNQKELALVLGNNPSLTISGTFSPFAIANGDPSGITIAQGIKPGAIQNVAGDDAVPALPVDVAGSTPGGGGGGGQTPQGPLLVSADFDDTNADGTANSGDVITLTFDKDVQVGQNVSAADFDLPVQGDDLGTGMTVTAGAQPDQVDVTLGQTAAITVNGTFDPASTNTGDPSGIDIAQTMTSGAITDTNGTDAQAGSPVDVDGTLSGGGGGSQPPSAPHVVSASFQDLDGDGLVSSGDHLTVTFNTQIYVSSFVQGSNFNLPVAGDSIGTAQVNQGPNGDDVLIIIGQGDYLTINGTFAPANNNFGDPSGIDIASNLFSGDITDLSGVDAVPYKPVDIQGTLTPPPPPVLSDVLWVDLDLDGAASEGDELRLTFSEEIQLGTGNSAPEASDFNLPVAGDSLGTNPTFEQRGTTGVAILLGKGAKLTAAGTYGGPGQTQGPSGFDISPTIKKGAIVSLKRQTAAPSAQALDIEEPAGTLTEDFTSDKNRDATVTTADWNAGGSGLLEGSLSGLDVGNGTTDLTIDKKATINTDTGEIDGTKSPAFVGAGRFEFRTVTIGKTADITVEGSAPLQILATDTIQVDGTIRLNGADGEDQLNFSTTTGGLGGKPGPGGFVGGDGGPGGTVPAGKGLGPNAGAGGASEDFPGGGAGGSFGTAGDDGETSQTTMGTAGPGGKASPAATRRHLVPLVGGSGGGGGGGDDDYPLGQVDSGDEAGAGGGGGGGAVRFAAGGDLSVSGTIEANGGNGGDGFTAGGAGGGGGAGGAILLQAGNQVDLEGSATLTARGGKGGAGETRGGDGGNGIVLVEDSDGKAQVGSSAVTGTIFPAPIEAIVDPALDVGTGVVAMKLSGKTVIDTDNGTINGSAFAGFVGKGVFEASELSVEPTADITVVGQSPLVLKIAGNVDMDGRIDLSGADGEPARGNYGGRGATGVAGARGGGDGGSVVIDAQGNVQNIQPTAGQGPGAGTAAANSANDGGGGGASFGTLGTNGQGSSAGKAGAAYGDDAITVLEGGSGGGGGAANNGTATGGGGGGGAGGGAIRIYAGGDVAIDGQILANGGNGGKASKGSEGGAGSGGLVHIACLGKMSVAGTLQAIGGDGGTDGGNGGNGRIRLEDGVGSFKRGTIEPAIETDRFATSVAQSAWLPVTKANAEFLSLIVLKTVPKKTAVEVVVEGAKADAQGNVDPTTATGFGKKLGRLTGVDFVRFRVVLRSDANGKVKSSVDAIALPYK